MQKDTTRNFALDVLRVLACYMVIQVHTGEFYYIGPVGNVINGDNAFWVNLYNSVCRSAVPLFVMLTGYFLLPVKDEPAQFFRKRFTRVIIPFIFWCIAYAFYQMFRGQVDFATACLNILKIPVNFGTEVGHLWYVYMLMGLYLFAPIISPWLKTASRKSIEFYLGLWGLTLLVPYIHLIFPEVLGECHWNGTPMLYYFSGLLGYMILAYYLRTYASERKSWNVPVGLALLVVGYGITWYGFDKQLPIAEYVPQLEVTWGYESINAAMVATGIFLLIKNIKISNPSSGIARLVTDISLKSYGIYLAHIMLLNLFYGLLNDLFESAMIKIPLISVCTFIATYIVVRILSYIPKSKYIIG